jgi:hypothetical protein
MVGGIGLGVACVFGGCEVLAASSALTAALSPEAVQVIGSAIIGAATGALGYRFTTSCRSLTGYLGAGALGALAGGGSVLYGLGALAAAGTGWNSALGTMGWLMAGGSAINVAAYLLADLGGGVTLGGMLEAALAGAGGAFFTDPLIFGSGG